MDNINFALTPLKNSKTSIVLGTDGEDHKAVILIMILGLILLLIF